MTTKTALILYELKQHTDTDWTGELSRLIVFHALQSGLRQYWRSSSSAFRVSSMPWAMYSSSVSIRIFGGNHRHLTVCNNLICCLYTHTCQYDGYFPNMGEVVLQLFLHFFGIHASAWDGPNLFKSDLTSSDHVLILLRRPVCLNTFTSIVVQCFITFYSENAKKRHLLDSLDPKFALV